MATPSSSTCRRARSRSQGRCCRPRRSRGSASSRAPAFRCSSRAISTSRPSMADIATASGGFYLDSLLAPLAAWLERPDVTDIYINVAQELWVETLGGAIETHPCPALTEPVLARLSRQIAAASAQGISREHPLLAASLPDGSRVQIVAPPATRGGHALAIRRHVAASPSLDDYETAGAFDLASTTPVDLDRERQLHPVAPDEVGE